jgi:flagellin
MNILSTFNASNQFNKTQADQSTQVQHISSGQRINSAKDDAADLSIDTRLDS